MNVLTELNCRLSDRPFHALAIGIPHPEIGLRGAISLVGGLAQPLHRLCFVRRDAPAIFIDHPETVLRFRITLLGFGFECFDRLPTTPTRRKKQR